MQAPTLSSACAGGAPQRHNPPPARQPAAPAQAHSVPAPAPPAAPSPARTVQPDRAQRARDPDLAAGPRAPGAGLTGLRRDARGADPEQAPGQQAAREAAGAPAAEAAGERRAGAPAAERREGAGANERREAGEEAAAGDYWTRALTAQSLDLPPAAVQARTREGRL